MEVSKFVAITTPGLLYFVLRYCVPSGICMCLLLFVCFSHSSQFSDSVTYTCAAAAPEAPPTPECINLRVKHVTVRWSSPDDNGGDY